MIYKPRLYITKMNTLKVQYCSDLHLELRPSKTSEKHFSDIVKPVGDILVLAGDIGNPFSVQMETFLTYCVKNWATVLYVPGNHEYYGNDYTKTNIKLYTLSKSIGFKIMEQNVHLHGHIAFIGCALWSKIDMALKSVISDAMNDYQRITYKDHTLTVEDTIQFHHQARQFLRSQIQKYKDYQIVVITHHAPVMNRCSSLKYLSSPLKSAFESDCSDLFEHVKYWIFGHTHFATTFSIDHTTFMSNPYGYYKGETSYDAEKYFEI